jgi:CRP-like cAMP-binding protein
MDLNSDAATFARLDAICDEYEQTFRRAGASAADEASLQIELWIDRVPPELGSLLRDELGALRKDLLDPDLGVAADLNAVPVGVSEQAWRAVTECGTFQNLSGEARLSLAKSLQPGEFKAGEVLLKFGQQAVGLFLITAGRVEVIAGDGEDRHELGTDGAGGVLGEMSLLTGHPCSADVVAVTPVKTLGLSVSAFDRLRSASPEIEIALSQLVSDRLGRRGRDRDALCGKLLGGYRLERCIGRGAMGVVYAAVDPSNGGRYALKMLRHRFIYSPQVVSHFDQEVALLRQLDHPNVVALREHFIAYRTRFIVLELYDGADLRTVIRDHGPLSESVVRRVLGQVAAGLMYAHEQGITHLDLKPANLLINRQGRIAITDFGLSRLIETDGCDREVVGTPIYMPPEQFMMANIGPHCDWYSFGCVACELLNGKPLFDSPDSPGFLDEKFRSPSSTWPAIDASDELCDHLRSALEPISEDRRVDLKQIAAWSDLVPELSDVLT